MSSSIVFKLCVPSITVANSSVETEQNNHYSGKSNSQRGQVYYILGVFSNFVIPIPEEGFQMSERSSITATRYNDLSRITPITTHSKQTRELIAKYYYRKDYISQIEFVFIGD
jgi:hypothetical protein